MCLSFRVLPFHTSSYLLSFYLHFSWWSAFSITLSWFLVLKWLNSKLFFCYLHWLWLIRFPNLIISVISEQSECTYVIQPAWKSRETFPFVLLCQLCSQFQPAEGPVRCCFEGFRPFPLLLSDLATIGLRCVASSFSGPPDLCIHIPRGYSKDASLHTQPIDSSLMMKCA